MENPFLIERLVYFLLRRDKNIGFNLDSEYMSRVKHLKGIMFLDLEHKGVFKKVLLLQNKLGDKEIKKIENCLKKTQVGTEGIYFDYITIIKKEFMDILRSRVVTGYPHKWHTYFLYLQEEPTIGIKVKVNINTVRLIGREEGVGLRPIKKIFIDSDENRIKNEEYLDVVSGMKRIDLKSKLKSGRHKWYNKYKKNFLKDLLVFKTEQKVINTKERIQFYEKSKNEETSDEEISEAENEDIGEECTSEDISELINEAYLKFINEK